jgi:transcriptional regulator with XRE-family HTH domain
MSSASPERITPTTAPGLYDPDLADDLRNTIDPLEILFLLRLRGHMTQSDIASAVAVNVRSVRAWESGSDPRLSAADRLRALAEIVATLAETLTPRGVNHWLRHQSRHLGGDRPIERIATGPGLVLAEAAAVGEVRYG